MSSSGRPNSAEMASAASSPPFAGPSLYSPELTPRSKIKALLASVEDGSHAETVNDPTILLKHRQALSERDDNPGPAGRSEQRRAQPFAEDEESEEGIAPLRNIGRRLIDGLNDGQGHLGTEDAGNGSDSDKENAYKRVQKQLLGKRSLLGRSEVNNASARASSPLAKVPSTTATPASGLAEDQTNLRTPSHRGRSSPGLFLTPGSAAEISSPESGTVHPGAPDKRPPDDHIRNNKFLELVARKREERQAKQAEEAAKKQRRRCQHWESEDDIRSSSDSDVGDREVAQRLTQQDRPARKASKKALEEMSRETQRMNRNMQLAHQAKTKKKITKESLLARFNFGGSALPTSEPATAQTNSTSASSAPASDHHSEAAGNATPPTSPIQPDATESPMLCDVPNDNIELRGVQEAPFLPAEDEELPDMIGLLTQPFSRLDKGKGKAVESRCPSVSPRMQKPKKYEFKHRRITIHPPKMLLDNRVCANGSDSDLEVMPSKKVGSSRLDVFDRVPRAKDVDHRAMQTLRALAHIGSPPGKDARRAETSVNLFDLQRSLQKRARQQALEERNAKIEDLKARGIIIQTAEEKEKDQVEVEDLLETARKGDVEIREQEKRAARIEKLANGESVDHDDLSDEDDEDYEDDIADEQLELSGSEEDQNNLQLGVEEEGNTSDEDADPMVDEEVEEARTRDKQGLIEDEASDDERGEADIEAGDEEEPEDLGAAYNAKTHRRRRGRVVFEDDEEERDGEASDVPNANTVPTQPKAPVAEVPRMFQMRQASKAIGMTQAFAATMASSQTQAVASHGSPMPFDSPPEPELPNLPAQGFSKIPQEIRGRTPPDTIYPEQETAASAFDLPMPNDSMKGIQTQLPTTQSSEMPDPTQDAGFVMSSPGPEQRFVSEPPLTAATLIIPPDDTQGSPVAKKRGRLQRRMHIEQTSDSENPKRDRTMEGARRSKSPDAFAKMKQTRKRASEREHFDKKKSEAKEMVEDQAQESEDEYAGLGGASDEESGAEDDELVKEMIDQGEVDVDEREIAAFYADKQRTEDGKAIQKLFKDINNGGLNRKRNNDFDLSDSDDDGEARRKRKQREFAKLRKALLANENVGKIAEDPKKMAFLKAIEDRDDYDELDFLDRPAANTFRIAMDTQSGEDCQPQSQQQPSQDASSQLPAPNTTTMRPHPSKRRTQASRKPATRDDIRESVSFLVEEPGSHNVSASSSDDESYIPETQRQHMNPRRTAPNPVIDRLTLKRQSSSSLSTSATGGQMAFHAPSASMLGNTFVPSLLRSATTNTLGGVAGEGGGHAATERAAGGETRGLVKKGGKGRSSVNFVGEQKKGFVEKVERRKREQRERMARESQGGGVVGLSRMGTWER